MPAQLTHAAYETPFGELHVFVDADGVVRASGFRPEAEIAAQLPAPLRAAVWVDAPLPAIDAALQAWLDGDGSALAHVPVRQEGSPFQQAAWAALRHVPSGEVVSYGELAQMAGSPRAARAAGSACAANAVALFVPCHRVVNASGSIGAYGFGGAPIKAAMLALEVGWAPEAAATHFRNASAATAVPRQGVRQ